MRLHKIVTGILLLLPGLTVGVSAAAPDGSKTLDIYFLDMMGGAATLIVTPLGESVLIDTGSLEPMHRDADRIFAAIRHAGLKQIDYLVTTHFHSDHFGGILQLTKSIPVRTFLDKGSPPSELEQDKEWFKRLYPLYQQATGGKVRTIRAGDDIPLKNDPKGKLPPLVLHCVAAEKQVEGFDGNVDAPCSRHETKEPDLTDNGRSIALVLRYGDFDFFAGGDITWNVEHSLACPKNIVGRVDLYQVTHHGLDQSNNPLLLNALSPTVAIAMNGPRKGIQPSTFRALNELAGLEALYQIHYNTRYGDEGNVPLAFIANGKNAEGGGLIKVSVDLRQKQFTVSLNIGGPAQTFPIK